MQSSMRRFCSLRNSPSICSLAKSATTLLVASLASGCASLLVPYLDPKPLNESAICSVPTSPGATTNKPCSAIERFLKTREAVRTVQTAAYESYADRARINSLSSALAFPLAGLALYRGVHPGSTSPNELLKYGLLVGAGYEAKNTLLANSPESIYILSEQRLSCVLDEAARYQLDFPSGDECNKKADKLELDADALDKKIADTKEGDIDVLAAGRALIPKVRAATAQYNNMTLNIQTAADHMQSAARKILSDTNSALKSPSISFNQATSLMKSEMEAFAPAKTPPAVTAGTQDSGDKKKLAEQIAALSTELNAFGRSCLRPQPATPTGFSSCITYSPAAPPIPAILTTLGSDSISLDVGGKVSFVATSTPSGTPWAVFAGDDKAAIAAMGSPQLITLSPNQTQVTLSYSTAVKAETKVILSLTTLGVAGNAKAIEITLRPAAAAAAASGTPEVQAASTDKAPAAAWEKALIDKELLKMFEPALTAPNQADLKNQLEIEWRKYCAPKQSDENKLLREAFHVDIKAKGTKAKSYCD